MAQEHSHDAIVHSHAHYHVTHNFRELTGGFEHLSSEHEHEHDHAPLSHRHHPHEDFESEHLGEAHVHDHVQPARQIEDGNGKKAPPGGPRRPAPPSRTPSRPGSGVGAVAWPEP